MIYANGYFVTKIIDESDLKITAAQIPIVAPRNSYSLRLGQTT